MAENLTTRIDKLLKAMTEGKAPRARKSAKAGRASGAAPLACFSNIQTPPDNSAVTTR